VSLPIGRTVLPLAGIRVLDRTMSGASSAPASSGTSEPMSYGWSPSVGPVPGTPRHFERGFPRWVFRNGGKRVLELDATPDGRSELDRSSPTPMSWSVPDRSTPTSLIDSQTSSFSSSPLRPDRSLCQLAGHGRRHRRYRRPSFSRRGRRTVSRCLRRVGSATTSPPPPRRLQRCVRSVIATYTGFAACWTSR